MAKLSKSGYKAQAGGILMNRQLRTISGCRVNFDPRSTEQAHETRSTVNRTVKRGNRASMPQKEEA